MVTVKYKSGTGDTVYISSTEAKEFERVLQECEYSDTVDIRGSGNEAKVESKPEIIRYLQRYFPDLVCGAEYEKSNGKLSVRLSQSSRAADKINSTMEKIRDSYREEKKENDQLKLKIDNFFKIS